MRYLGYCFLIMTAAAAATAQPAGLSAEAGSVLELMHSRRELMQVDFDSICGDLLSIFSNKCNCGNAQQVQSGDSIDCDNGKLTAHAEFEDLKIASMKICDKDLGGGKVCSTIYYASTIAVHCVLEYDNIQCDSCFVCDADGLLGLRVNCDSTKKAVTTNGCEVASTYLHLNSGVRSQRSLSVAFLLTSILIGEMLWS